MPDVPGDDRQPVLARDRGDAEVGFASRRPTRLAPKKTSAALMAVVNGRARGT
jgi:hypothetical protein